MISRITIFSLLLGLLLATGLALWSLGRQDDCRRFLAGDPHAPSAAHVVSGSRQIVVPCSDWSMRQPQSVQLLLLALLALAVVFVLNAALDLRNWLRSRRLRHPAEPSSPEPSRSAATHPRR